MTITVNTFVWVNEPGPNAQPEKITTDKPLADDFANTKSAPLANTDDANVIYLSQDASLLVERSQYTEDMMGPEPTEDINKEKDSTEKE